jgi:hypothetical protein
VRKNYGYALNTNLEQTIAYNLIRLINMHHHLAVERTVIGICMFKLNKNITIARGYCEVERVRLVDHNLS